MKTKYIFYTMIQMNRTVVLVLFFIINALSVQAQLNPFEAMFYQNQYLYNPALAGLNKGLNINIGHMQQWSNFPGTPKTSVLTADLQAKERVGLGLNVNSDQAGLIRSTRIMGTYAYHLPLSNHGQYLSFGLSLGINDSRLNDHNITGDPTDEQVLRYNQLKPYVDGDMGIAYSSSGLNIGGALPNLKTIFFKGSDSRFDVDRLLFVSMISYKIHFQKEQQAFLLEPLASYRIVKGYKDIIDAGINFTMENYGLYIQGIYHSSESIGLGFGLDQKTYALNFAYNVETGTLRRYTNGTFEMGIKLRLFNK